jgi:hypothetical protein
VFGTSSTNSASWKFTLPSATISGKPFYSTLNANAHMFLGSFIYLIMPILTSTTEVTINLTDSSSVSVFAKPLTTNMFASGNSISICISYEAA